MGCFILSLFAIASLIFSTAHSARIDWANSILLIDFDMHTTPPYKLFIQAQFLSTDVTSVRISREPFLGSYGGHAWTPGKLIYIFDVISAGFSLVDVKLGFAEVYRPACIPDGRIMTVSVNDDIKTRIDVFK